MADVKTGSKLVRDARRYVDLKRTEKATKLGLEEVKERLVPQIQVAGGKLLAGKVLLKLSPRAGRQSFDLEGAIKSDPTFVAMFGAFIKQGEGYNALDFEVLP